MKSTAFYTAWMARYTYHDFNKNNQKFGRIAKLDNSGRGYWYSVDERGYVRTHHYYSAGFGRS